MPIPLKNVNKQSSSLTVAQKQLEALKRRYKRNSSLNNSYTVAMQKLLDKGYAEKVLPTEVLKECVRYIPHHPVTHPSMPKLRIVFDCAAKESRQSLNDLVWSGTDLTNRLISVLIRFREEAVTLVSDISTIFHQVYITPTIATCCRTCGGLKETSTMKQRRFV